MIKSFKHKGLEKFFRTGTTQGIQAKHAARLRRILDTLHHAEEAQEVNLPGFRLHSLSGKLKEHWAVDVSGNWRMTFYFEDGNAYVVNYQDYH